MTNDDAIRHAHTAVTQALEDLESWGPVGQVMDKVVMWRRATALLDEAMWYLDHLMPKAPSLDGDRMEP